MLILKCERKQSQKDFQPSLGPCVSCRGHKKTTNVRDERDGCVNLDSAVVKGRIAEKRVMKAVNLQGTCMGAALRKRMISRQLCLVN